MQTREIFILATLLSVMMGNLEISVGRHGSFFTWFKSSAGAAVLLNRFDGDILESTVSEAGRWIVLTLKLVSCWTLLSRHLIKALGYTAVLMADIKFYPQDVCSDVS